MQRRRAAHVITILRKIHFYDARFTVQDENGNQTRLGDPSALFRHIRTLVFRGATTGSGASRYSALAGGNFIAMIEAQATPEGVRGIIGTVRRNALPDVEALGRLQALNLPANAGLFEATHFVLFLPDRILGMEFNLYGPRTGRLESYLLEKCPDLVSDVRFEPILRQDVSTRLQEMGEISLFEIAVRRDQAQILAQLDESLAAAFEAARRFAEGAPEILELVLRKRPYARQGFFRFPLPTQGLLGFLADRQNREALVEFKVKARNVRTHAVEMVDLLEDKMISTTRVVAAGERRRSVDRASMFREIVVAFQAQREELLALREQRNR